MCHISCFNILERLSNRFTRKCLVGLNMSSFTPTLTNHVFMELALGSGACWNIKGILMLQLQIHLTKLYSVVFGKGPYVDVMVRCSHTFGHMVQMHESMSFEKRYIHFRHEHCLSGMVPFQIHYPTSQWSAPSFASNTSIMVTYCMNLITDLPVSHGYTRWGDLFQSLLLSYSHFN